jgi:hypothetical protein
MVVPAASRPYMPGYGIAGADEGSGLLPWSWAEQRLEGSHDFWVSTTSPDGRQHIMPVWGVWDGEAMWFSSGLRARKIRNIQGGSRVSMATVDPQAPVVVEGAAEIVTEPTALQEFIDRINVKYETDYKVDFLDPTLNASVRLRPQWAFGLDAADFGGSPTRWVFAP